MDVISRAKGLILDPAAEWARIAPEGGTPKDHLLAYAVPMAAIPAVAGLIGTVAFAGPGLAVVGIVVAVLGYVLSLASVFVLAKLIEALAPSFGGVADPLSAMKLSVYSPTAAWLAGLFSLVPALGFLGLLGLYSAYIYWVGVPHTVRVPDERRVVFTVVLVIVAVVVNILIGMLIGLVVGALLLR